MDLSKMSLSKLYGPEMARLMENVGRVIRLYSKEKNYITGILGESKVQQKSWGRDIGVNLFRVICSETPIDLIDYYFLSRQIPDMGSVKIEVKRRYEKWIGTVSHIPVPEENIVKVFGTSSAYITKRFKIQGI